MKKMVALCAIVTNVMVAGRIDEGAFKCRYIEYECEKKRFVLLTTPQKLQQLTHEDTCELLLGQVRAVIMKVQQTKRDGPSGMKSKLHDQAIKLCECKYALLGRQFHLILLKYAFSDLDLENSMQSHSNPEAFRLFTDAH